VLVLILYEEESKEEYKKKIGWHPSHLLHPDLSGRYPSYLGHADTSTCFEACSFLSTSTDSPCFDD